MQPNDDQSNQSNQPQQNPILTYYNEWVERTPYVTRITMMTLVLVYLVSWFIAADEELGDIPIFTVESFEIYRILTAPIVGNSIIDVILIFLFFPQMGGRLESYMGSTGFLLLMLTVSVVTNILFVFTCYMLFFSGVDSAVFWSCSGFWTILFAFITIECLQVPDAPRQLLCIPINIPSKYFPLVLYLFFSILSLDFRLSLLISMVIGYLYSKGYLDRLKFTSYYLEGLEAPGAIFHGISRQRGWALAAGTGHDAWIPVNTAESIDSSTHPNEPSRHNSGGTSSGGRTFPNLGTLSSLSSSDTDGQKKETTAFPGSGHKLAAPTTASFVGTSTAPATKEAIAQRRLAALAASNQPPSKDGPSKV